SVRVLQRRRFEEARRGPGGRGVGDAPRHRGPHLLNGAARRGPEPAPRGAHRRAMRVAELWRYPVKSMAGERLEAAALTGDGLDGDRVAWVEDPRGGLVTARTRPRLLGHHATLGPDGGVLVDGRPWDDAAVARDVALAADDGARLVTRGGERRFDVLPLLVATDGAIAAMGLDLRR